MSPEQITAVTGLVVALSGLIGVAVASYVKLRGIAATQAVTVAASAARDVKLDEVHAAIVPAAAPAPEVKS